MVMVIGSDEGHSERGRGERSRGGGGHLQTPMYSVSLSMRQEDQKMGVPF